MKQQQQTRASPDGGLMITQDTVVSIIARKLLVYGIEAAQRDFEALNAIFSSQPGWAETKAAVEELFIAYRREQSQKAAAREIEMTRQLQYGILELGQLLRDGGKNDGSQEASKAPSDPSRPDLSDGNIGRCLRLLMEERTDKGDPLFYRKSHWQAVFRVLSDAGKFADDDFDGFDSWVDRAVPPDLRRLYTKQSVKNISQTLFNKPFKRWTYDPKLMKKREPYDRMKRIAARFRELLDIQD